MKSKRILKSIILVIILAMVLAYFLVDGVRESVNNIVLVFSNQDRIQAFIASYGSYAIVISFVLMVFQSLIAPLPAFIITLTNAALFGWWQGAILSWSSAMVGAALCFFLAKLFGRDFVVRFTSEKLLKQTDSFFEKYGSKTILITRLLPFVSFDLISYAAGLTNLKWKNFLIATGIGQLPATIVYSYVGGVLNGGASKLFIGLVLLFALAILISIIRQIYVKRTKIYV
jgi:uncharacterized membrane protein YdjX (TVP38/TMEM64 family)